MNEPVARILNRRFLTLEVSELDATPLLHALTEYAVSIHGKDAPEPDSSVSWRLAKAVAKALEFDLTWPGRISR